MKIRFLALLFGAILMAVPGAFDTVEAKRMNPCNPCNPCGGMKMNPCNPCGGAKMSNPCNPCNPCGGGGAKFFNPCNPCAGGVKPIRQNRQTSYKKLVKLGKKLWNNEKLGNSGLACATCHDDYELLNLDKKVTHSWPHYIKMTDDVLTLDQMINFCMMNPMKTKPLNSTSISMTALAAYYAEYVKMYVPETGMNPCNPCGMKMKKRNPCNPCGR